MTDEKEMDVRDRLVRFRLWDCGSHDPGSNPGPGPQKVVCISIVPSFFLISSFEIVNFNKRKWKKKKEKEEQK